MKKKILIGFIMDGKSGGIHKYLLNLLENIWTEDLQIDFLSNEVNAELVNIFKKIPFYHLSNSQSKASFLSIPSGEKTDRKRRIRDCLSKCFDCL